MDDFVLLHFGMYSCDQLTPVYYHQTQPAQSMRAQNNNNRHINYFFQELLRRLPLPICLFIFVIVCPLCVVLFSLRHSVSPQYNLYFLFFSVMKFPEISINRPGRAKNKISKKEMSFEYVILYIYII